jgi:hypothetical protein
LHNFKTFGGQQISNQTPLVINIFVVIVHIS